MRRREDPAEAVDLISAAAAEPRMLWEVAEAECISAEPRIPWVAAEEECISAELRILWVAAAACISAAHLISAVGERLISAMARISAACMAAPGRASAADMSVVHLILPAGRRHRTLRDVPLSTAGARLRLKAVPVSMASVPPRSGERRAGLPTGRRR